MTVEHHMLIGIEDIKRISFQCENCDFRISMAPQDITEVPWGCQTHHWEHGKTENFMNITAVMCFLNSLKILRTITSNVSLGFRVLLEFEEPKAS